LAGSGGLECLVLASGGKIELKLGVFDWLGVKGQGEWPSRLNSRTGRSVIIGFRFVVGVGGGRILVWEDCSFGLLLFKLSYLL